MLYYCYTHVKKTYFQSQECRYFFLEIFSLFAFFLFGVKSLRIIVACCSVILWNSFHACTFVLVHFCLKSLAKCWKFITNHFFSYCACYLHLPLQIWNYISELFSRKHRFDTSIRVYIILLSNSMTICVCTRIWISLVFCDLMIIFLFI